MPSICRWLSKLGLISLRSLCPSWLRLFRQAPQDCTRASLVSLLVSQGPRLGLIRPSRRYRSIVPALFSSYAPLPTDLPLTCPPRHSRGFGHTSSSCTIHSSFYLLSGDLRAEGRGKRVQGQESGLFSPRGVPPEFQCAVFQEGRNSIFSFQRNIFLLPV
jgi:hypothetical protein